MARRSSKDNEEIEVIRFPQFEKEHPLERVLPGYFRRPKRLVVGPFLDAVVKFTMYWAEWRLARREMLYYEDLSEKVRKRDNEYLAMFYGEIAARFEVQVNISQELMKRLRKRNVEAEHIQRFLESNYTDLFNSERET